MQAVQLDEPNGNLTLREVPVPKPKAGQVLIRMAAAPLNLSDLGALSGLTYGGKREGYGSRVSTAGSKSARCRAR